MQPHNGKSYLALGVVVVTMTAAGAAWAAEAPNAAAGAGSAFSANSTLVLVPVTVVDHRGAIVNGLGGNSFKLTEDGAPQAIRSFSEEDAPVSLGIVLDLSGSMRDYLPAAKEALRVLLKDANPGDEVFVNGVSTQPRAYSGFEDSFEDTLHRIESENASGRTALIDTIYDSAKELRAGKYPRKALIVISDGIDNHSRYTNADLRLEEVEAEAQIYTIATVAALNAIQAPKPMMMTEAQKGLYFLEVLAAKTGGLSYAVSSPTDISKAAASIGRALRNQYTIGYAPGARARSGKWHKISVKVDGSGMKAYARTGYRGE
jgi:Ca-activated chloride channel family protein